MLKNYWSEQENILVIFPLLYISFTFISIIFVDAHINL